MPTEVEKLLGKPSRAAPGLGGPSATKTLLTCRKCYFKSNPEDFVTFGITQGANLLQPGYYDFCANCFLGVFMLDWTVLQSAMYEVAADVREIQDNWSTAEPLSRSRYVRKSVNLQPQAPQSRSRP